MSLNNELPGRTAEPTHLCTKGKQCVFGGDVRARQFERSIGGLLGQGYCVEGSSLHNVEAVEIFSC